MNATELRIANLVKDELTGEFMKISDLSENKITAEVIDRSKYPLPLGWKIVPIPITEEILSMYGFKSLDEIKDDFLLRCVKSKDFVNIRICGSVLIGQKIENGSYCIISVKRKRYGKFYFISISSEMEYLHTLQNYYPALSDGSELEITL